MACTARRRQQRFYRMAATQGHVDAHFNLGLMYANGIGIAQGWDASVRWLSPAAEQGHARSQYALAMCHENGWAVQVDATEALRWYGRAAAQGLLSAQAALGRHHAAGFGGAQDRVAAHMWLSLTLAEASAQTRDGIAEQLRGVEAGMTPDDIAEAERRAREWTPTPEPASPERVGCSSEPHSPNPVRSRHAQANHPRRHPALVARSVFPGLGLLSLDQRVRAAGRHLGLPLQPA